MDTATNLLRKSAIRLLNDKDTVQDEIFQNYLPTSFTLEFPRSLSIDLINHANRRINPPSNGYQQPDILLFVVQEMA